MADVYAQIKGVLSAKATAVTDAAANTVGDFRGDAAFNLVTENAEWAGQDYWVSEQWMTLVRATLNVAEVAYQPNKFDLVFGVTASVGATKETTPVTASVQVLDTTWSGPAKLEWLMTTLRENDSDKKFQVWTYGSVIADFPLAIGHGKPLSYALGVGCALDSSGDLARFIFEN
jgi:hypothetical protein